MIQVEVVSDPDELAQAERQEAQYRRNWNWFQSHCANIYREQRGKCLCISGEELFVGDSAEDVLSQARARYPDDEGRFLYYVPRENVPRVYADRW